MPILTNAQALTLKANINANTASYPGAIAARDASVIRAFYNALAAPDYPVWQTKALVEDVHDAISWDKFTPVDSADGTAIFTSRMLAIQTKQINLQSIIFGRLTINASKVNIRSGLRDAVIALPAGAAGAAVAAAGASAVTLMTALTRKGRVGEKLLFVSLETTGTVTAAIMGFEGDLSNDNILAALDAV